MPECLNLPIAKVKTCNPGLLCGDGQSIMIIQCETYLPKIQLIEAMRMPQDRQLQGGISTLMGVRFEIKAVLYELPDLLEGRIKSIRYQPLSSAISPVEPPSKVDVDDYSVEDESGQRRYVQVKQNTQNATWTVNRLLNEGVITQFWGQHKTDPKSLLIFVSDKPAPRFKSLADYARRSISSEEFLSKATQQIKKDASEITEYLGTDIQKLREMLKVTDHLLLTEEFVNKRLRDFGSGRYSDVEKFALVLKDVVEQSPGKALTKDVIEDELEKKGLFRLPLTLSEDVSTIF